MTRLLDIYGIRFRVKGKRDYMTALFQAFTLEEAQQKIDTWIKSDAEDVDQRTVTWTGASIPLSADGNSNPVVFYIDVDEHT